MNADLLAMLSGGGLGPPRPSNPADESGTELLKFKAGRMKAELQQNGKFLISPDPRRGEIRMLWKTNDAAGAGGGSSSGPTNSNGGVLTFEWVDRRTTLPVTTLTIFPEDNVTFCRVFTGDERETDRVYLLQYGNASDRRFFFWMQDLTDVKDGEHLRDINKYCSDPAACAAKAREISGTSDTGDAAAAGGTGAVESADLSAIMQGLTGGNAPAGAAASGSSGDALSSIVENLTAGTGSTGAAGAAPSATPAPSGTAATPNAPPRDAAAASAAGGGGITLADLQGAMAGLATSTPPGASPSAGAAMPGPPLSELATADAIETTGILSDASVRARLIELLPEGQRTDEMLEENLRSPQVQQCLKSLTAALADGSEFNSILANFSLKPEDGAAAMASGNPIQAFLDCVLKQVQREKDAKEEEEKGDESKMEEG